MRRIFYKRFEASKSKSQNPLIYNGEQREEYGEWIMNNLKVLGNKKPYYVLIV
jgi:hypothetical protein